jgi:biopolymer transport protein ExbD
MMMTANETNKLPGKKRFSFSNRKWHSLKLDMTPMVDLGFLLITFFVITTQLCQPKTMNLFMPADGPPLPLGTSNALTFILDKENAVYYYNGDWETAIKTGSVFSTSYSGRTGIRKLIQEKQSWLDKQNTNERRNGLMLLIKPADGSTYNNVVDALDEATISQVGKYAILPLSQQENIWLKQKSN